MNHNLIIMRAYVFLPSTGLPCCGDDRQLLHISQPAVINHVHALEEELGVLLLDRVAKRVTLTDAGQIVQHYAEQVLGLAQETQRALRELQGLQRGTLRLGASSTPGIYLLPPV